MTKARPIVRASESEQPVLRMAGQSPLYIAWHHSTSSINLSSNQADGLFQANQGHSDGRYAMVGCAHQGFRPD